MENNCAVKTITKYNYKKNRRNLSIYQKTWVNCLWTVDQGGSEAPNNTCYCHCSWLPTVTRWQNPTPEDTTYFVAGHRNYVGTDRESSALLTSCQSIKGNYTVCWGRKSPAVVMNVTTLISQANFTHWYNSAMVMQVTNCILNVWGLFHRRNSCLVM